MRKLREQFGLRKVALVGGRGIIIQTRFREDLKPTGLDWITDVR